ncbi:Uncharacterised protein [Bordetella pertussis]|nr:Uncharacterised protein [Bordetella pertussis]CFU10267.1 Uncharacterised protein [Bordetella pertussis]CFW14914.1 Uncharacterised protein [Bordetella pertussis]CFW47614.1 Uncharacterised protein [Bordetella pertussis]CPJ73363.1 Uncharacterised protein [Bordetella pertussis]
MASATPRMPAAPTPCASRPAISHGSEGARPHAREARVNSTRPAMEMRRWPMISPSDAMGSSAATMARW